MGPGKIIRRQSATSLLCPILGSRLTLNGCHMVSLIERFVNGLFDLKCKMQRVNIVLYVKVDQNLPYRMIWNATYSGVGAALLKSLEGSWRALDGWIRDEMT
jgi:hypothetical protein